MVVKSEKKNLYLGGDKISSNLFLHTNTVKIFQNFKTFQGNLALEQKFAHYIKPSNLIQVFTLVTLLDD